MDQEMETWKELKRGEGRMMPRILGFVIVVDAEDNEIQNRDVCLCDQVIEYVVSRNRCDNRRVDRCPV